MRRWGVLAAIAWFAIAPDSIAQSGNTSSQPTLRFDVTSVKENLSVSGFQAVTITPDTLKMPNRTVIEMLQWAYNLPARDIVGEPAWAHSRRFDVDGRVIGNIATVTQLRAMMRTLLAERFALRAGYESKIGPVYALTINRSGGKLGPGMLASTANCKTVPADGFVPTVDKREGDGFCGMSVASSNGSVIWFGGLRATTTELARSLSRYLDRPVIDQTGLTSPYDFVVTPIPAATPNTAAATPLTGAEIFTAIQEQLGLRLRPDNGEVEVLVIRNLASPTEN